jgi:VanZ family protein
VLDPGLSRFAFVLLCYVLSLAALATLSPFDFDFQHVQPMRWVTTPSDIALNLAFLFPVGFLLRLMRAERAWPFALDALVLGLLVSLALELTQMFLPTRFSSPSDVLFNGLGAWLGGIAHAGIGRYLDRRLQRQLSLHLPLANLLYLSVPMLSLDGLSTGSWDGCLPEIALACFVAENAAGLYKHRLEGADTPFPNAFAGAIGALFGIGYMPIVVASWQIWLSSVALSTLLTRFLISYGTRLPATERRFVPITVLRSAPFFVLYILLLGSHAWLRSFWESDGAALRRSLFEGEQVGALALLRDVAAFTLLGYLGSELQARSMDPLWRILSVIMLVALPVALFFGGLRYSLFSSAGFGEVALLASGSVAGGLIHRAQLRLVKSWSHNTRPPVRLSRPPPSANAKHS